MTYVKLNDKVFELISPDIYINQFQTYLNGDTIDFEGLDIQTKYTALERLFDYTCKSFTIVYGGIQDDEPDFKYSPQIADIRARMSSVDRMQKFCKQSGKI